MSTVKDPFDVCVVEEELDDFAALSQKPVATSASEPLVPGAATARFHGFDLDDRPLLVGLPGLPGEIVPARTTVPLRTAQAGATAVVVFDQDDVRRPIVIGVIQEQGRVAESPRAAPQFVSVQADDDRFVVTAEREIVLRCGEASITLTRAGKVLIKGTYVLSRASGYNKIKGAAVDIN